jgi:hypothetical protein
VHPDIEFTQNLQEFWRFSAQYLLLESGRLIGCYAAAHYRLELALLQLIVTTLEPASPLNGAPTILQVDGRPGLTSMILTPTRIVAGRVSSLIRGQRTFLVAPREALPVGHGAVNEITLYRRAPCLER